MKWLSNCLLRSANAFEIKQNAIISKQVLEVQYFVRVTSTRKAVTGTDRYQLQLCLFKEIQLCNIIFLS